ncbi:MAG: 1-acyl-sn-glycerol-3-phosphate acyltransferase [Clostridia bacterium]|nr:1-acyl-sn-glycerol-3-phosphate acyltransferase [Clostridia bacterium]
MNSINNIFKKFIHPILLHGTKLFDNCRLRVANENSIAQISEPIIFVVNHSNGHDFPMAAQAIKTHFYILADFTMKKDPIVNSLNRLNGCVYVDRKNTESKKQSKEVLIKHLNKGHNILLFPEGTWNLHPSKLLLPLNWGCIDLSKETNAPIVPITILYRGNQAYVNIGEPFFPIKDKQTEIIVLEELMSTLLWKSMCLFEPMKREMLPNDYEEQFIKEQLQTYKKLDLQYEKSVIRDIGNNYNDFTHLNIIEPKMQNAFLFNKRLKG